MAKKQQKYICINSYICHVYISINHFKSLCGKTIQISITERETDSRREEHLIPVNTPAALQINTHTKKISFKTLLRMYKFASVFITNKRFSSKSFKYSTKCTMNMEWRCKPGVKIHYLLTCFVACFF